MNLRVPKRVAATRTRFNVTQFVMRCPNERWLNIDVNSVCTRPCSSTPTADTLKWSNMKRADSLDREANIHTKKIKTLAPIKAFTTQGTSSRSLKLETNFRNANNITCTKGLKDSSIVLSFITPVMRWCAKCNRTVNLHSYHDLPHYARLRGLMPQIEAIFTKVRDDLKELATRHGLDAQGRPLRALS